MTFSRSFSLILALASVVASSPATRNLVLHEERENVPSGFTLKGPAAGSSPLTLRLALNSQNLVGLESALYDVSSPSSASYGQHLTKQEVEAYVAPTEQSTSAINEWLSSEGLTSAVISPAGNWISVNTTVAKANELLGTTFSVYTHDATGKETTRSLSYSVPAALSGDIELIHPTIAFPVYKPQAPFSTRPASQKVKQTSSPTTTTKRADVPSSCLDEIEPTCLQAIYGIPATPAVATTPSNGIAVAGFIDQWAQTEDLETFLFNFRTDMDPTTTFILQEIDGGEDPQDPADAGTEANLDTQYTVGLATDVPIFFISVGPDNEDGISGFLDIVDFILGEETLPWVMTTSYSFNEDELTFSLANNLCNAYMQLGARGISALFSSGDGGVSGDQAGSCDTFVPTFPSTCPFVTAVGATSGFDPEVAADFSSGGFSNLFDVPSYQADVVPAYLESIGTLNEGLFNTTGRGFPDVSAQGVNYVIVAEDEGFLVDGTSCSTPMFASVIGLLNNELLATGKSTLGWLNPLLYANPSVLNDITSGDNPGCGTNGFNAVVGWDPITGLGTPDYPSLLALVTA